jgi:peroxiredoxin Q/BCP
MYKFPITLLSDPKNTVLKAFGVKNLLFLTGRETFVVGLDGKIAYSFRAFLDGSAHPEKVLSYIRS